MSASQRESRRGISGRALLWVALLVAPILAGAIAYDHYTHRPVKTDEYADVRLGMSQAEVKYVRFLPDKVYDQNLSLLEVSQFKPEQKIEDFFAWSYPLGSARLDVSFDREKRVNSVARYSNLPTIANCPTLLGVNDGVDEATLLRRLGEPSETALDNSGSKRIRYLSYGGAVFYLVKKRVYMLSLERTDHWK